MNKNALPIGILICLVIGGVFFLQFRSSQLTNSKESKPTPVAAQNTITDRPTCIPTFSDGDGPYYLDDAPFRQVLVPESNPSERFVVSGKVVSTDCSTPLSNVVLDIWQANDEGVYDDEWYRGRVTTGSDGEYSFTTVIPKGYSEGTAYRPPHIHFKVWQDEKLLVTSEMFLPEALENNIDPAFVLRLSGNNEDGVITHYGNHTIVIPNYPSK